METPGTATIALSQADIDAARAAGVAPSPTMPDPMDKSATEPADAGVELDYLPEDDEILDREDPSRARLLEEARDGSLTFAGGGEKEIGLAILPTVGLGLGAFALVALFLWGSQRILTYAGGMRQGLSHGASREVAYVEPDSASRFAAPAYRSPAGPGGVYAGPLPGNRLTYSQPLPQPARIGVGPFVGDIARAQAEQSVRPLHDIVQLVQRFQTGAAAQAASGPRQVATINPSGEVAPVTLSGPSGTLVSNTSRPALDGSRAALFAGGSNRLPPVAVVNSGPVDPATVQLQTEALSAQVSMATHDEAFPAPLRAPVHQFSIEMHSYLNDTQLAAIDSVNRATLQTAAGKRIARAQSLLTYIDNVVAGNTDPNVTPMP